MYGIYNLKSARYFLDKLKVDRREISTKEMNFIASNSNSNTDIDNIFKETYIKKGYKKHLIFENRYIDCYLIFWNPYSRSP